MNTIRIGEAERRLEEADPQWIHEQLEGRRRAGSNPCVRIHISEQNLNIEFETPNCGSQPRAVRRPNEREAMLFELWNRHQMNVADFTAGNLQSFVQQLRRSI